MRRTRRAGVVLVLVAGLVGLSPAVTHAGDQRPCPVFTPARVRGTVTDPGLEELSGLAASRTNPGLLWAHADSGAEPAVHALSNVGERLVTYTLDGATNVDWEDMAVGPGPAPGQSYLYVGDIGGNSPRSIVTVYRVPEPIVDPTGPDEVILSGVEAITVAYPDGSHDAEALLVDPRTGDLFIVTKALSSGPSGVYRLAAPLDGDELEHVATVSVSPSPSSGSRVTAGDISPAGDEILLRGYSRAFVWRRGPAQSVAAALGTPRCSVPLRLEAQGEAIAYRADGNAYLTASEWGLAAEPQPLLEHRVRWRPDGWVRRRARPAVGDDVVNRTGAGQTIRVEVGPRGRASFTVRVTNDGDRVDDIRVRGTPASSRFLVRYRRNSNTITGPVTQGTHQVRDLAPGAGVPITVEVVARAGAPAGASHTVAVTLTSDTLPRRVDRVRMVVTRR